MKDGSIFLAVADGIEELDIGVDLYEFAEILKAQGAKHAINLDGGGSTTMVLNKRVWNFPNCDDQVDSFCERPVTTSACIKYPPGSQAYSE
jgi:exopolysaccharide biosynthesis protein